jgi:hypothetical protein
MRAILSNDEPEDAHPASYSGSISGDRMLLTIRLTDSNQTIGAFSLTRGSQGALSSVCDG